MYSILKTIDQITDQISTLNKLGNEILIVTSGAVTAGKQIMISKKSNVDLNKEELKKGNPTKDAAPKAEQKKEELKKKKK